MKGIIILSSLSLLLFSACESGNETKRTPAQQPLIQQSEVRSVDTIAPILPQPDPQLPFKVKAYLIYDDGSLSDFDILNDRTKELWNTIIGAGVAEKPSNRTMIHLTGNLDSLNIKLSNESVIAIDSIRKKGNAEIKYFIRNTGCEEVYIRVSRNKRVIYNDTIFFRCGE
jgi:hypothetical protein